MTHRYKPQPGDIDRHACQVIGLFDRIYKMHPELTPANSIAELAVLDDQIASLMLRRAVVQRHRAAIGQQELFAMSGG